MNKIELLIEKVNYGDDFVVTTRHTGTDSETGVQFVEEEKQACCCCEFAHDCSCATGQLLSLVFEWASSMGESYGQVLINSMHAKMALDKEEHCIIDMKYLPDNFDWEKPYKMVKADDNQEAQ